ncbi:MAG: alpha/beta fold hydrolase [Chloroflexota bacterium]
MAVAIYKAHGPRVHSDPVIYLGGGPGFPTLGSPDGHSVLDLQATEHTVILLDQRGVGYSRPALACPELERLQYVDPDVPLAGSATEAILNLRDSAAMARALQAARACRRRFDAQGVDAGAFTTDESAADVEDLRRALGYDRVNLFGVSYGTRLALVTLRRFPGHLRSVILDGVFPPQVQGALQTGVATVYAFHALFSACAATPACNRRYPHLEAVLRATVERLDRRPATIAIRPDVDDAPPVQARLSGDSLLAIVAYALAYAPVEDAPRLIYAASAGKYAPLAAVYAYLFDGVSSYGQHYSVECGEDEDPTPLAAVAREARRLPAYLRHAYLAGFVGDWRLCHAWRARRAADGFSRPVRSGVPTLLLSGQFDWATPPPWAALAAATLARSTAITIPGVGHQAYVHSACARRIVWSFLDRPLARPSTTCLARAPIPWR